MKVYSVYAFGDNKNSIVPHSVFAKKEQAFKSAADICKKLFISLGLADNAHSYNHVYKEFLSQIKEGEYIQAIMEYNVYVDCYEKTSNVKFVNVVETDFVGSFVYDANVGVRCKKCKDYNNYAEPNQDDGSYLCYSCR